MSRTADLTALATASKNLLGAMAPHMEEDAAEGVQLDMDSVGILLAEFESRQLNHDPVQWVLWHLLEHVLSDAEDVSSDVPEAKLEAYYDALDDYVEAFEEKLKARAKIACPRLDALLTSHWAEADGGDGAPGAPKPAPAADEEDEDPEDELGEEDEDEGGLEEEDEDDPEDALEPTA